MNPLIYEWRVIKKFADQVCDRICNRVVRYLRSVTDTLSGDDSPLTNAWEEICAQVQSEQSIYWDTYESVIDQAIEEEVKGLPEHELAAVWFQTPEGEDWGFTDGSDREEPYMDQQQIVAVIRDSVLSKAGDYTNSRIREFLDRSE
jgi:DNA phosphorothioation-dependent restriction protein DptG